MINHVSLSARRAWIEISIRNIHNSAETTVALRKESVDRNDFVISSILSKPVVALRKESVDRNDLWGWAE